MPGPTAPAPDCDVALVGGGLANSLIALRLRRARPELSIRILEAAASPPRSQTWSVFGTDMAQDDWELLAPAFEASWEGYSVSFPNLQRELSTPYASLTGTGLAARVDEACGGGVLRGRPVAEVGVDGVVFEDGETLSARVVIDGRGARRSPHLQVAYQKFLGLELRLRRPHGLQRPIVMDATVRQEDGYRFLYVLPLGPDRLLVEDTRYSDNPTLEFNLLESAVTRYARGEGWTVAEVLRREHGVLPVALGGDVDAYHAESGGQLPQVGMRGLFFHPTTGYSLPDACRVARHLAEDPLTSSASVARRLREVSTALWRERGFYRALNRMLFFAAAPHERYRVLERFYRLPQPLIERFYAGRSTLPDKLRILAGRPPVPIGRALAALPERMAHA
jgi:lycopene beta-cyclase